MANERTNNISAQEALKEKAPEFVQAINSIVQEINDKVNDKDLKPKYRFMQTYNAYEAIKDAYKLKKDITDHNFEVDIYEDLECKDASKGNKYTIRISNIGGVFVEIDLLYYEEKIKDFEFDATEYIANNLAKIAGSVSKQVRELAPIITEYIACIMYTKKLYKLKYNKVGWDYYLDENNDGSWIFKYDQIYSNNMMFFNLKEENSVTDLIHLKGHLPKILADGLGAAEKDNLEKELEWVSHTIKLLNNHYYDGMILGAGISGLVRQLLPYTKETNININIVGKPASGKSTICHYLLSIFGNPERIEGSFIDTENSMEETRAKRPVLPYVLDDRMLKIETENEKNKQKIILMDIFREYEGKVKERYGKQYEETSGDRIYGPIISSSVDNMMEYVKKSRDIGQYRRFMEFEIGDTSDKLLFADATEATTTERIAYKNYGYGITIIIDYMMRVLNNTLDNNMERKISSDATTYINRFEELKNNIENELNSREESENHDKKNVNNDKVKGMASSAGRFALIILSYQILRESLIFYNYNFILSNIDTDDIKKQDKDGTTDNDDESDNNNIIDEDKFNKMFASASQRVTFLEFEKNSNIIKDCTDEILKMLIDNLVAKMKGIKSAPWEQVNKIYNYIIKNREHFKEGKDVKEFKREMLQKIIEVNGEYLGFCVINESEKKIDLFTPEDFYMPQFLYADIIPEPEVIIQYIRELKEQNISGKANAEIYWEKYKIKYEKSYNIKRYTTSNLKKLQGFIKRTFKPINDESVHFLQFSYEYKEIKEDDQE